MLGLYCARHRNTPGSIGIVPRALASRCSRQSKANDVAEPERLHSPFNLDHLLDIARMADGVMDHKEDPQD